MAGSLHAQTLPVTHPVPLILRLEGLYCVCVLLPCRCHVMERESFTSLPVAKLLNDGFCLRQNGQRGAQRCRQGLHDLRAGPVLRNHPRMPWDTPKRVNWHASQQCIGRARLCPEKLPLEQGRTCGRRLHATRISTAC